MDEKEKTSPFLVVITFILGFAVISGLLSLATKSAKVAKTVRTLDKFQNISTTKRASSKFEKGLDNVNLVNKSLGVGSAINTIKSSQEQKEEFEKKHGKTQLK